MKQRLSHKEQMRIQSYRDKKEFQLGEPRDDMEKDWSSLEFDEAYEYV